MEVLILFLISYISLQRFATNDIKSNSHGYKNIIATTILLVNQIDYGFSAVIFLFSVLEQ